MNRGGRVNSKRQVELPQRIEPEGAAMGKEVVAALLALRPIANIMNPQEAEWTRHPDGYTDVNQRALEPLRAVEALVDHPTVHADRVAEQQGDVGCPHAEQKRTDAECRRREEHSAGEQAAVPKGFLWIDYYLAGSRVGISSVDSMHRRTHVGRPKRCYLRRRRRERAAVTVSHTVSAWRRNNLAVAQQRPIAG